MLNKWLNSRYVRLMCLEEIALHASLEENALHAMVNVTASHYISFLVLSRCLSITQTNFTHGAAVELLSEVVQSAALSEAEIEQQRGVILKELDEVEGSLQDVCLDLLHATAYQGTPLAQSVLGPSQNARYAYAHAHVSNALDVVGLVNCPNVLVVPLSVR